jgi:hypothetical protein
MSGLFGSGQPSIKIPKQQVSEPVKVIEDDATEEQRRERRRIAQTEGRESTILSGISTALKKRLGE